MECPICAEEKDRIVTCFCDFNCCTDCCETFILGSISYARCMNCKVEWTNKFMNSQFGNWVSSNTKTGYRTHVKKILKDREKAKLPETMALVPALRQKRADIKILENRVSRKKYNYNLICADLHKIISRIDRLKFLENNEDGDYKDEIEKCYENQKTLQDQKIKKWRDVCNNEDRLYYLRHSRNANLPKNIEFICPCPEECTGLISAKFQCAVCDIKICETCREKLEEDHTCDPKIVKTIKAMEGNTKPCPKCATPIFRISGCFAPETPIRLFDGTVVPASNIQVGDALLGDDGKKRIVQTIKLGNDQMYEIQQNKADNYTVNSYHTLVLKYTEDRKKRKLEDMWKIFWFNTETMKNASRNFETEEEADAFLQSLGPAGPIEIRVNQFLELAPSIQKHMLGYRSDVGVIGTVPPNPIDPYILGLWLGDGYSNGTSFSLNESETLAKVVTWAAEMGCEVVHEAKYRYSLRRPGYGSKPVVGEDPKCCDICSTIESMRLVKLTRSDNPWITKLRSYGLLYNKHIPQKYMNADSDTRRQILAGLIDSDGTVNNGGKRVVIVQKAGPLGGQIAELARSLGFCVHVTTRKILNRSIMGSEPKNYSDQYGINISGQIGSIPTLIPRKKCIDSEPNKDPLVTSIKVVPRGVGTYIGWSVSGPNRRFVLPDFTVVRNCSQMWCTKCHAVFDWNTLQVEIGTVHNPHALEWQRQNGTLLREPGDIPCGDNLGNSYSVMQRVPPTNRDHRDIVSSIFRRIGEITRMLQSLRPNEEYFDKIRLEYAIGDITEKQWVQKIFNHERENQRNRIKYEILDTLRTITIERFIHYSNMLKEKCPETDRTRTANNRDERLVAEHIYIEFINECSKIRDFINSSYETEMKSMGSIRKIILIPGEQKQCWYWA